MRVVAAVAGLMLVTTAPAATAEWETRSPLPVPRTEVSAAVAAGEIVILGGYTADGATSRRVDAYAPARDTWRRLPDLPVGVNHAAAVGVSGRVYVLGGYSGAGAILRTAFELRGGAWHGLPRMPFPRAAAGAGVSRGRIVVAGGVGDGRRLARNALVLDPSARRWSVVPGPTPREHLGVTSLAGIVYAVGGRTAGLDTNLLHFESFRPGDRSWKRLQPVPDPRGGTGAAGLAGQIVSVGGEEPGGTISEVLAYRVAERRWVRLPDLPTPRHGLGVAAIAGRIFVIGGGPEPGLTVSSANEVLPIGTSSRRIASADAGLLFRRANGSRIVFRGRVRAWCGAWNDPGSPRTLHVAVLRRDGAPGFALPYWHVSAVASDLARRTVIRFPVGINESHPRGAFVFATDALTRNEASTEEEEARGSLSFAPVRCALGNPVRFTISATMGSEFGDGKPIRANGTYEGTIGDRPPWWPR
jgi:N-acetylneuraminic acid mutarotase